MAPSLGSRQQRVLDAIRSCQRDWGSVPVHLPANGWEYNLPIGYLKNEEEDQNFISGREAYKIAERLEELGLVEIDLEERVVRPLEVEHDG